MAERERPLRWRPRLRALHRDIGYLAVGLTIVYAVSGLAVNHILDWNPNFVEHERTSQLASALPDDQDAAARAVARQLQLEGEPSAVFRAGTELEFSVGRDQVLVDEAANTVLVRGQRPRFFVRMANWLHLQRGKKAWNIFADAYAIFLLFLAGSGLFMLPGKKGIRGRGGVLVLVGVLAPAAYVVASGGPSAKGGDSDVGEPDVPAPTGAERDGQSAAPSSETSEQDASRPAATGAPVPPPATGAPPPPLPATGAPPPPADDELPDANTETAG